MDAISVRLQLDSYIVQKICDNAERLVLDLNRSLLNDLVNDPFLIPTWVPKSHSHNPRFMEYMKNNLCEIVNWYWFSREPIYDFDVEKLMTHLEDKNNWAMFEEWLAWHKRMENRQIHQIFDVEYTNKKALTTCLAARELCRAGIPEEVIEKHIIHFKLPASILYV